VQQAGFIIYYDCVHILPAANRVAPFSNGNAKQWPIGQGAIRMASHLKQQLKRLISGENCQIENASPLRSVHVRATCLTHGRIESPPPSSSLTNHPTVEFIVTQKILLEYVEGRNHRHILCPGINRWEKSLRTLILNFKNLSGNVRAGSL